VFEGAANEACATCREEASGIVLGLVDKTLYRKNV